MTVWTSVDCRVRRGTYKEKVCLEDVLTEAGLRRLSKQRSLARCVCWHTTKHTRGPRSTTHSHESRVKASTNGFATYVRAARRTSTSSQVPDVTMGHANGCMMVSRIRWKSRPQCNSTRSPKVMPQVGISMITMSIRRGGELSGRSHATRFWTRDAH